MRESRPSAVPLREVRRNSPPTVTSCNVLELLSGTMPGHDDSPCTLIDRPSASLTSCCVSEKMPTQEVPRCAPPLRGNPLEAHLSATHWRF